MFNRLINQRNWLKFFKQLGIRSFALLFVIGLGLSLAIASCTPSNSADTPTEKPQTSKLTVLKMGHQKGMALLNIIKAQGSLEKRLRLQLPVFQNVFALASRREGAKKVLQRVHDTGNQVKRLNVIWMDGGYRGEEFMHWVMDMFRWIVEIVLRPLEKKGFVHLPKRWLVERTFGWLNWCRRLSKDYERLPETSETFIYIAMIRIMVRRLA